MYQDENQLWEIGQLCDKAEELYQDLRYEAEAAIRHCAELTEERDDKGYRLLEAEDRIKELEAENQRLLSLMTKQVISQGVAG